MVGVMWYPIGSLAQQVIGTLLRASTSNPLAQRTLDGAGGCAFEHARGVAQGYALAPAPLGTGLPGALPPVPAAGPRSPYDPIFNPIISKATPGTQLQSQTAGASSNMQTVSASSNGVVTTYNSPQQPAASSSGGNAGYGSGSTGSTYTSTAGSPSSSGSGYGGAAAGSQSQPSAYSQGGQQQQQSGYSSGQQPSTQQ